MIEPLYYTTARICGCGRPRYMPDDLIRWIDEERNHDLAVARGEAIDDFNPEWAQRICWLSPSIDDSVCRRRPLG